MATINGTANNDTLTGTDGADIINAFEGDDILDGGAGNDSMNGGLGNDIYVFEGSDSIFEHAGGGNDTVYMKGTIFYLSEHLENVVYIGPAGVAVEFTGNAADNRIVGGSGNDYLDGNGGADTMVGKGGDDTYYVRDLGDIVTEAAGEGNDLIWSYLPVFTLFPNVERLMFSAEAGAVTATGNATANDIEGSQWDDVLDGKGGADRLAGFQGNDTYHVDDVGDLIEEADNLQGGVDTVVTTVLNYGLQNGLEKLVFGGTGNFTGFGNAADNHLTGGAGDDRLHGMGGNDTMTGGAGNDIYYVGEGGDQVIEGANAGIDRVVSTRGGYTLPANVEELFHDGSNDLYGFGNELDNVIRGGAGNDRLDGMAGADRLIGGKGNDAYIVDDAGDIVEEDADSGWDLVHTTLGFYTLTANVEDVHFIGNGGFVGIGNDKDNWIVGGAGSDSLSGEGGADLLKGKDGNDTYWVNNAGDLVVEQAGEGTDFVYVSFLSAYKLPEHVENMQFNGADAFKATGNGLDNAITAGFGNDQIDGGAGADTMAGRKGNDSYTVDDAGDVVVELAGEGNDTVWTTLSAYTLTANVESLVYGGAYGTGFTGTGNAIDNLIEGGEGNDILDGGAGADVLNGRGGNDVYVVDSFGDIIGEQMFGGIDEVRTALGSRSDPAHMYVLHANVENLTGTSAGAQGVYGNALGNVIKMGGGGDLVVLHDGGDDTVQSGGGNDFLYFGNAFTLADQVDGGAGNDTVGLLGSYTLTFGAASLVGIEKLALYGSGSPFGFGFAYDLATIDANVAAGKQLTVVAQSLSAAETLTFNGSAETDGAFNVRGGKGADAIVGGAGNDVIWGGLGADTLSGGAGSDLFQYRSAAESTINGFDRILDFGLGDRIDLKAIDSDGNAANGNGKFAFIGAAAFSQVAGQLRAVAQDGSWLIQGDINGDGFADLSIVIAASDHLIGAGDFIL